jgi:hypothetical protein
MVYPLWFRQAQADIQYAIFWVLSYLPHPHVAKGDKFITVAPIPVTGLVQWLAPLTSNFECVIPQNTVLIALNDSAPRSTAFGCEPLKRREMEAQLVPEQDRTAEKYGGYYFVLPYKYIGKVLQRCQ